MSKTDVNGANTHPVYQVGCKSQRLRPHSLALNSLAVV
jgi:hypothetical protein